MMVQSLRGALANSMQDLISPVTWARIWPIRAGRVEMAARTDDRVEATVRGSMPYQVELLLEGDAPGWSCSWPTAGLCPSFARNRQAGSPRIRSVGFETRR
jgi:hypothetical protein